MIIEGIEVDDVQRLALNPGDVMVLLTDRNITEEEAKAMMGPQDV